MPTICEKCGHCNDGPLSSQSADMDSHSWSTSHRAVLAGIESEISRCKKRIAALEEQHHDVEAQLLLVVYPVLSLPNEITSRIFIECLPSYGSSCRTVRPSASMAPLLLAQICHDWREIALATCQLWDAFDVDLQVDYMADGVLEYPTTGIDRLLRLWFSRAKGCPLSLTMRSPNENDAKDVFGTLEYAPDYLTFLSAFAAQFQCLESQLSPGHFRHLRPLHTLHPFLERLATSYLSEDDLQDIIRGAPKLCELHLIGKRSTWDFASLLPATLADLEIDCNVPMHIVLEILTRCSHLLQLKCGINVPLGLTVPVIPTIFPQLQSLTLLCPDVSFLAGGSLRFLTLPNLHCLQIMGYVSPILFLPFITRSSCTLRRLALDISGYNTPELSKLLAGFPSAVETEFLVDDELDFVLTGLIATPSTFPQLEHLTLCADWTPVTYELLLDFLQKITNPIYTVRSVLLQLTDPYPPGISEGSWQPQERDAMGLKYVIASGIDFRIRYINTASSTEEMWPVL